MADSAASSEGTDHDAPLPDRVEVAIVGGGIAGLASAWQLAKHGAQGVLLLEAEPMLATHASGRNAAIFLPLEESLPAVWLASRSRDLLDERLGTSWLRAQGVALLAGSRGALDELRYMARRLGTYHERWSSSELAERLPALGGGDAREALHLPLGGIMDVHAMLTGMRSWAVRAGVRIVRGAGVEAVELAKKRVAGLRLRDGRRLSADRVVVAAGAWGGSFARELGSVLTLTPHRRHLVQLVGPHMPRSSAPVAWRVDEPLYFRPEGAGILASPCDETPVEPGLPEADPGALELLSDKLGRLAPQLLEGSHVQRSWACLRTMTPDRELAVGADPRIKGLYWCAGLGGRGMTCGAAAGELLARTMLGGSHPLSRALSPERFG